MAGPVRHVQVTETLMYDGQASGPAAGAQPAPGGPLSDPPAVAQSVSGGRLSLGDPACASSDCSVSFAVSVPSGVTVIVTTEGGPVTVSGIAGANLDSGGGPAATRRWPSPRHRTR